ncbi:MAG: DUF881 domain-containing protein [Clostridiales bacterium]|nr:DUF881 domain-containing protein [Clostridiales bacterium]
MKITSGQIVIGILALIIGLSISIQIGALDGDVIEGGLVPIQKAQSLAQELQKIRNEKEILVEEVTSLEAKIKEIEEAESKDDILLQSLISELDKYKMISGMKEVKGPGIIITIDDPPAEDVNYSDVSVIMYNYELLLSLLNKLNDAGAEAISINGQRIVAITEISLAGSNVNINSVPTAPPFEIKAIGNPETLDSTLNIRFGIIDKMRNRYSLQVKIQKSDEVVIPRYNEIVKFRYAVPVE